jgi:hypothetical protein
MVQPSPQPSTFLLLTLPSVLTSVVGLFACYFVFLFVALKSQTDLLCVVYSLLVFVCLVVHMVIHPAERVKQVSLPSCSWKQLLFGFLRFFFGLPCSCADSVLPSSLFVFRC